MARGQKMPDRLRELVLFELACNDNAAEVARIFNLPESTVHTLKKKHKDQYEELRRQKVEELIDESKAWKKNFIDQAQQQIVDAMELGHQKIKLATAAVEGFENQINKMVDLLSENKDTNGKDIVEVVKALSSVTNIPLAQISTYFGTLYDKAALASGQATSRGELTGADGGPIVVKLPEELGG
jgi:hypothetical protein